MRGIHVTVARHEQVGSRGSVAQRTVPDGIGVARRREELARRGQFAGVRAEVGGFAKTAAAVGGVRTERGGPDERVDRCRRIALPGRPVQEAGILGAGRAQETEVPAGRVAGDEGQHLRTHAIEPLHVVHHGQDRGVRRGERHQRQRRVGDQQAVGAGADRQAQCDTQAFAQRGLQVREVAAQGQQDLVEAGEADVGLELGAGASQDADSLPCRDALGRVEQGRLTHSRITVEHQRRTTARGGLDQCTHRGQLAVAAEERRRLRVDHPSAIPPRPSQPLLFKP